MKYQVTQDGADFYLFDPNDSRRSSLLFVITYTDATVRDLPSAQSAREWLTNRADEWGWTLLFPNPFL